VLAIDRKLKLVVRQRPQPDQRQMRRWPLMSLNGDAVVKRKTVGLSVMLLRTAAWLPRMQPEIGVVARDVFSASRMSPSTRKYEGWIPAQRPVGFGRWRR